MFFVLFIVVYFDDKFNFFSYKLIKIVLVGSIECFDFFLLDNYIYICFYFCLVVFFGNWKYFQYVVLYLFLVVFEVELE